MRGRNRSGGGGGGNGGGGGGGGGGGKGPNPLTRSYESNGPDVKIRGTAGTIADKYVQLSRDALTSGDPVAAENYMQHAEHYYRMLAAAQAQYQPHQTFVRADADDFNDGEYDEENGETAASAEQNAQPQQNNGQSHNNGQQPRFNGDRDRDRDRDRNGGRDRQNGFNGQGGQANGQNAQHQGGQNAQPGGGERRFDRNERRDRPERSDRQPRPDRGAEEQPFVGDLPSFITGGEPVRAEPARVEAPRVETPRAEKPKAAAAPVPTDEAPPVAADEDGEAPVAARGRRRRFGRAGRVGAEGDAPEAIPAPDAAD